MYTIILLAHVIIAITLIALVLLQQGRGSEAGAAFGSGASATVFGARGSSSFLSRITAGLATGFFVTSLVLAYFATQASVPTSVVDRVQSAPSEEVAPAPEQPAVPQIPQAPKP
ncbi:MAG: preprotein translocase subunit SecG [Candidatus Competibacteraceae bacterium]